MTNILVTGGSGFFGEALAKKLLDQNHNVTILDLNQPGFTHQNLRFIQGDIRNFNQTDEACKNIEIIHHNVAQVPIAKDNDLFWAVNYDGTKNILEAALSNKVKKLVYTSSSAVYGVPKTNPVTEQTKANPGEEYGKAKYAAEKLCNKYRKQGLNISIVRPRTILGHGRLGIFQILFEWIYQGYNIPVLGSGDNIYQFIHSSDMADACIAAGFYPENEDFNIGAKEFYSMRDTLENLTEYAGTGSKVKSMPMSLTVAGMKVTSLLGLSPLGGYHSLMYGRSMYFDITKAEKLLGFKPKYSSYEMFQETYDWYILNREKILSGEYCTGSKHQSALKQKCLSLIKYII